MSMYMHMPAGLCPPDIFSVNNSIYVTAGILPGDVSYEIAASSLKLAQIFYVYNQFVPSKASVYIKTVFGYSVPYFDVSSAVAIDALNFSALVQGGNKNIVSTSYNDFSGKGCMYVLEIDSAGSYAISSYPIKATQSGNVNIYLRGRTSTGRFVADLYLDSALVATIDQLGAPVAAWGWFGSTFNLPDNMIHTLKIRMRENGNAIDRFCIGQDPIVPGNVNDYQSSYITLHFQIYSVNAQDKPVLPLYIYGYKTTLDEMRNHDWYNFAMSFLDDSLSTLWDDKYAIVLFSSGSSNNNYLIWELTDNNDPYICGPSAIRL